MPSYSQFVKVCPKETKIQNVKTGGAYASSYDVISGLYCRVKYGVTVENTIQVDECWNLVIYILFIKNKIYFKKQKKIKEMLISSPFERKVGY